jgi:hypothetical protein
MDGAKAAPDMLLKKGDVALFQVRATDPKAKKIEVMLDSDSEGAGCARRHRTEERRNQGFCRRI